MRRKVMPPLPIARNENIVVQNVGKEILIYNLAFNKAFCLNETLAKVYTACDGKTTFEEFKNQHRFTDDLIFFSLDELKRENLIETDSKYQSPFAKLNRREVVRKIGFAILIALPLITSLVAPEALKAASVPGPPMPPGPCVAANGSCTFDGTYTQGVCCDGLRCLDINACVTCRTSGTPVYNIFTGAQGCTPAACNTDPRRNWCCSGSLNAFSIGPNLCDCRCQ
jgi:hypothetical protein